MSKKNDHILMAYRLDKKGGAQAIDTKNITDQITGDSLIWLHLQSDNKNSVKLLKKKELGLESLVVEALLADETRPRIAEFDNGTLIILRGVNLNEDSDPEDMVSIRLWIDNKKIISVRKRKLKAVLDIEEKLKAGKGPTGPGDFICTLISNLFNRVQPFISSLDDKIDDIEENIIDSAESKQREIIISLRKQAIMFKRYMSPQKDVVNHLKNSGLKWLKANDKRHLQESFDQVTRYIEDLDAIREKLQIIKDELMNSLTEKLNKNTYVISIIATIFLPLGFLTGVFGVNLAGIPGTDNPVSFWIFNSILLLILVLQIFLFKKFRWF